MGNDAEGVIVVTDTSVVLNLAWLGEDRLLANLFGSVLAPPAVRFEFERLAATDHRFRGLRFPDFIIVEEPKSLPGSLTANNDLDAADHGPFSRFACAARREGEMRVGFHLHPGLSWIE